MSLFFGIAALFAPFVLCCWPAALVVAALGIFVGVNAYHRSTGDSSRIMSIAAILMASLGAVIAVASFLLGQLRIL
jgi:hypothetical protein